ncbi:hypothetical protein Ancab_038146 [Ancistrocladus abbreviatus]
MEWNKKNTWTGKEGRSESETQSLYWLEVERTLEKAEWENVKNYVTSFLSLSCTSTEDFLIIGKNQDKSVDSCGLACFYLAARCHRVQIIDMDVLLDWLKVDPKYLVQWMLDVAIKIGSHAFVGDDLQALR